MGTTSEKDKAELLEIIRRKSFREGDFTLASGKKSRYYFDLKQTTLSQRGMKLVGELAIEKIQAEGLDLYAVGGMTLGADPVVGAIVMAAERRGIPLEGFIVRKEPKGHGTGKWLEGVDHFPAGAKVLLIEDVVTTAGSGLKSVEVTKEAGFAVQGLLTVVDRQEGGAEKCNAAGVRLISLCTLNDVLGESAADS